MPIQRFGSTLVSKGSFDAYMDLLKGSFQPQNLAGVMCRSLVSVDWQGWLYDCDFNQQLGLPLGTSGVRRHLRELLRTDLRRQVASVALTLHDMGVRRGDRVAAYLPNIPATVVAIAASTSRMR